MKAFYSLTVVLSVLIAICAARLTDEQRTEFEKKILDECKGPSGADDDDIKRLLDHEVPQTRSGKCLLSCSQEKLGILVDGQISVDGFKALGAKKYEGDEKAIGIFNELIEGCTSISDPDACELGAKVFDCMVSAAVKRGIDLKKGIQS